ncbi:MAG: SBBP repeat-containing protein [bacterium]
MQKSKLRTRHIHIALTLFLAFLALGVPALRPQTHTHQEAHVSENNASSPTSKSSAARLNKQFKPSISPGVLTGNLPLSFEPNRGQANPQVKFIARGSGYNVFLTSTEAVFSFPALQTSAVLPQQVAARKRHEQVSVLRMTLKGANPRALANGTDQLPGVKNYFIGRNASGWQTNVPTFRRVRYQAIYPGINLSYYGNQKQLEYDFEVAPGADPGLIRLVCEGAKAVIDDQGDLVLKLKGGELRQHRPVIYQDLNGRRVAVDGRFVIHRGGEIGFEVGAYDKDHALVIDPTLVYSTYLGGSGTDSGSSIDIDNGGNIYITGTTGSITFPTQSPYQSATAGLEDVFVTKLDPTGGSILYSTFIGGAGNDRGDAIFVDKTSGAAYIVGRADALSINFPTTPGAFATTYRGGDFDAFVLKLNPQGNSLAYSTFLGGGENDSAVGVAADSLGNAYVTGGTRSSGFPATPSAYQSFVAGDTDAYLVKVNPAGSSLLYSTLLGGGGTDRGSSVRVDNSGNAYLIGYSSSQDFPTATAFQNSLGGGFDAFVARIDTNASGAASLVFCSYLGGSSDDKGYGLAIDSGNNLYIAGQTTSTDFPLLNPAQAAKGGSFDAFIAKITSSGARAYSTYLGGSGDDRATGIAVNSAGNAYVTGYTASTNFPTAIPLQISNGGGTDTFITKLNTAGDGLLYSTYLGGSLNEDFTSTTTFSGNIAVDSAGNAYVTGYTASNNFPTVAPFQPANAGGASDVFIVKISDATPAADFAVSASPPSQTVNPGNSTTYTITVTPAGGFTGNVVLSVSGLSADASSAFNPSSINIPDANAKSSVLTITTTSSTPPGTYTLTISASSGNLQHNTSVSLIVAGPTSANLALTKTASPNPAIVNTNLTYRIVVTNKGPSPATNVVLTDTLPAGITLNSASSTQGTPCSGTTTITCNFGNIPTGASAIASLLVTPQAIGQINNTASVTANEFDPDTSDNSVTITTQVTTQSSGPAMLDPNLSVQTVISGLSQPTGLALFGNGFFVIEKDTGKVKFVMNGAIQGTPLDLAVNSASERGLLGIVLHPNFAFNHFVYLFWTESSTGADSTNLADVALLGNRVDRYSWNGSTLVFDRNLIKLRSYQADAGQSLRGNHNGGVLRFGFDGKLYILMGDNGRRGFLQNNQLGPVPDDQYGGPEPDDAHLTGFVLRLNDDGSTPADNPFYDVSTSLTGQAAANIKKLYAYGVRNGFGLAFDPLSGNLWNQENGDDAFDEMNRVTAGSNNGWVQTMGPVNRVGEFKSIESTYGAGNLQQLRWPPSLIADTPSGALAQLYMLPGAHYNDPEFSWKYALAPAAMGFVQGRELGPQFEGDMLVGAGRTFLSGGYLFRFKLTSDRLHFSFNDSRLLDLVADNTDKFDITESESLLIGKDFGIATDIQTGPNGNVFVVSNTNGAVYEISGNQPTLYVAHLNGAQEIPPNNSTATGTATLLLSPDETTARVSLNFNGLSSAETVAHIHGPGAAGVIAPVLFPLPQGEFSDFEITLTVNDVQNLKNGLLYADVHSNTFVPGEIRGQFQTSAAGSSFQFSSATNLVAEGTREAVVKVTRLGDTSASAKVSFATSDSAAINCSAVNTGAASSRCDYEATLGSLDFAAGETFKTISIPLIDDSYAEGNESFFVTLTSAGSNITVGSPAKTTVTIKDNDATNGSNPIDTSDFFVRQHYLDFLNREPDSLGFAYWTNDINSCGTNQQCIDNKRINVSAAFFLSIEFQETGYLVYRTYKAAYGNLPGTPVPLRLEEFLPDSRQIDLDVIVGSGNWATQLENNKVAYFLEFVSRSRFSIAYPTTLTPAQFVDALFTNAGVASSPTDRTAAINEFGGAGNTVDQSARARALRRVAENTTFKQQEFNRAFVLMQYFGYLRRNPNDLPDTDFNGYSFWLNKLNQFNGNFADAEMVKAFLVSIEYRARFGP